MGACCDLFEKDEIFNNQSRIKMLETKVQAEYHTQNDSNFTYYLHYFDQHRYLQKALKEFREAFDRTEDSGTYQLDNQKIEKQYNELTQYLEDCENPSSNLSQRIAKDSALIKEETGKYPEINDINEGCMIKFEIQSFQMVQGITNMKIGKSMKIGGQELTNEESIVVGMQKLPNIYRQLHFATVKPAKIILKTATIQSTVTVDVEDIMKNEAVCSVFKFQNKDEDFGFIALRMQFVTNDERYNRQRKERLTMLHKQLKLCLTTKSGILRSSISESQSNRNTFISDHVSQYQNQYHV